MVVRGPGPGEAPDVPHEVVVVVAVEVEKEAVVARGTSTGSLVTTELESRLRTSEEAVARAIGEPSRTMCPRRARRRTPPWTPRARTKPPPKRNPRAIGEPS